MSFIVRGALSAFVILLYGWLNARLHPMGAIMLGQLAGQQLQSSDTAYVVSNAGTDFFRHLGVPFGLLLLILLAIWWAPLRLFMGAGGAMMAVLAVFMPQTANAYYQKSDYTEPVMIQPSETAFWVPSLGDNKNSQMQLETEDYYRDNKIPSKLFLVPHMKLQGSGTFFDFYVPAGRLIIVDRTMYSREWVSQGNRGTSVRNEGFPCQSSEGLDVTVGISIGAEVLENDAPRFLSHFRPKPIEGSRTDPNVIFNAVYYSPSLSEVMDQVVRPNVQTEVCKQIMARSIDQNSADANAMMAAIHTDVSAYLKSVGITLDYIGWADTFTFSPTVQNAIDQRYAAEKLRPVLDMMQQKAMVDAVQKNGWNGALPQQVSLSFWPESWTKAISGLARLGSATPAPTSPAAAPSLAIRP